MHRKLLRRILIAVGICLFAAYLSSMATQTGYSDWYLQLKKPGFTPPDWLFVPVGVVLYVMMGIAAGIVWSKGFYHKWVQTALYFFGFQLLLSGGWYLIFFGLQEPLWALVEIAVLFVMLVITIRWFKIINSTAAYLLVPYAIWVLFAAGLNFEIWRIN